MTIHADYTFSLIKLTTLIVLTFLLTFLWYLSLCQAQPKLGISLDVLGLLELGFKKLSNFGPKWII